METPEFFQTGYYNAQFTQEKTKNVDHFIVDDLLDYPNDDGDVAVEDVGLEVEVTGTSPVAAVHDISCNSSFSAGSTIGGEQQLHGQFSGELSVPYDDLAELEWLSNFEEEDSFSSEDLQKLHLIRGLKTQPSESPEPRHYQFHPAPTRPDPTPRPAKARSKRSRTAPDDWTSRLLALAPPRRPASMSSPESGGNGRRCLHCATDKTPQWRTGPMGPKTLCNACGVRYKSGRLVPEYRPASSPTFVVTKHSNSHRKVVELRRQKEMVRANQQMQFLNHHDDVIFDESNGEDYLIHQRVGPDFRQMI